MLSYEDCYKEVLYYSSLYGIRAVFFNTRGYLVDNEIFDTEKEKKWFIKMLEMLLIDKKIIISFDPTVVGEEKKQELDNCEMKTQLSFIYNSFPTEYDEDIMEKDIYNLWWYCCCPAEIGWLREDGSYWFG